MLPAGWEPVELDHQGPALYRYLRRVLADPIDRFLAAADDPDAAVATALARVLDAARDTPFAAKHGLARVRSLRDWQDAVPIRPYDATPIADRLRHPVETTLLTSGTTGRPKAIAVTAATRADVADAVAVWIASTAKEDPEIGRGKLLATLGFPGDTSGPRSMTGLLVAAAPPAIRQLLFAVPEVDAIADPALREYAVLRLALESPIRSWLAAHPSAILVTCRAFHAFREPLSADLAAGTLAHGPAAALDPAIARAVAPLLHRRRPPDRWHLGAFWDLRAVHCWASGPSTAWTARLDAALGVPVREIGLGATEGIFAVALHGSWRGGVARLGGPLMELVPEEGGDAIAIHEGEPGRTYRLVISTAAGLYRTDLDDLVRIEGHWHRAPVLSFVAKGPEVLNATGEKVTLGQIAEVIGPRFAVAIVPGEQPFYRVLSESPRPGFDEALRGLNIDYDKRRANGRLGPAVVEALSPGSFDRWRAGRSQQVKEPIVLAAADVDPWLSLRPG